MSDEPAREPAPGPPAVETPLWRRLFPFVFAGGLTAFVLLRVDWGLFVHALSRVSYPLFVTFMVVFVVAMLASDTLATAYVYRHLGRVAYVDLLTVRGASYVATLVNHHVGQAWLTWLLAKVYRVPIARVAGGTLFAYVTWGGCLLGLSVVGVLAGKFPAIWVIAPLGLGAAYLALLWWKPARLARNAVLAQLFEAGPVGHLRAMAMRVPHLVVLFVGNWAPFLFFGVDIPLRAALVPVSVIMVSTALPLTPVGVGTRDALAVGLLQGFVTGAATSEERVATLAASTTAVAVTLTIVQALVGLALTRGATRLAQAGAPGALRTGL